MVAGRINNYRSVYLGPTRKDIESGRRTGMETISFTEHEERRQLFNQKGWEAFTVIRPTEHEKKSDNDLKNNDQEPRIDTSLKTGENHFINENNLKNIDKKLDENRRERQLDLIEIQLADLENSVKRREFLKKMIEEYHNYDHPITFVLISNLKNQL